MTQGISLTSTDRLRVLYGLAGTVTAGLVASAALLTSNIESVGRGLYLTWFAVLVVVVGIVLHYSHKAKNRAIPLSSAEAAARLAAEGVTGDHRLVHVHPGRASHHGNVIELPAESVRRVRASVQRDEGEFTGPNDAA